MARPSFEYITIIYRVLLRRVSLELKSLDHRIAVILEPATIKRQKEKKSKYIDPPPVTEKATLFHSEERNVKSEVKQMFEETMTSLDLLGNYLEVSNEENFKPLKQLFDRGKSSCDEPDKAIDLFLHQLVSEAEKPQDSNHENFSPEKHSVLELPPAINTVSREASEKDLEVNFEENSQLYSDKKQQQEKQQFTTTHDNHHDRFQEDLVQSLHELRQVREEWRNKNESRNFENYQERAMKAMEDEIRLLRAEKEEILAELGQIIVEKTANERDVRKSEFFQKIYRSSSAKLNQSTCNEKLITEYGTLGYPNDNDNTLQEIPHVNENACTSNASRNGFTKPQSTNTIADPTSLVHEAVSGEQAVQRAESLVKENNHQLEKEKKVTNDKDERKLHDGDQNGAGISNDNNENKNPTAQNLSSIASKKKANGGEGVDQSGNVSGTSNASSTSREEFENIEQSSTQQIYESLSFSVQQDYSNEQEKISLTNVPPTSVATTLYNNYKLLLLSLGPMLLSSEVTKLMTWATQNFPIVNPQNATHVLFQLDQNEVINASDLSQLRHFFESIVRFDLVYVIDAFLLGDYGILRQITTSKKRDVSTTQTPQNGATTRYQNLFNAAGNSQFSLRDSSLRAEDSNEPQRAVLQQKQQAFPTLVLNNPTPNDAKFVLRSPNENHSSAYGLQSLKSGAMGFTASQQVVVDGHVTNERRRTTGNSSPNANSSATSNPRNTQTIGSNGSRLSTLRRNQEQSDNWLCSHYKRHCYVKFECCDQFWPCHRCHNNQSTCGRKKLKSRDTQMVKCVYCNKVQQFGEHCCDCGAKFANYYCGKCKHLTGTDDHPYHCEKCGICRIHGDRSFHCDICGVCLDVQLRGNHKCREGSAHDECCICLEDAFTGCQILPCSHKVHKECATQMIRSGITRCPICRESFAHKLERRPLPNSRKRGK